MYSPHFPASASVLTLIEGLCFVQSWLHDGNCPVLAESHGDGRQSYTKVSAGRFCWDRAAAFSCTFVVAYDESVSGSGNEEGVTGKSA